MLFERGLAQAREARFAAGFMAVIRAPSGSGHLPLEQMHRVPCKQYSLPLPPMAVGL